MLGILTGRLSLHVEKRRRWTVVDETGKTVGRAHIARGSTPADIAAWLDWYDRTSKNSAR